MSRKYTARIEAAITPQLRERLRKEALRRHYNLSKTIRTLLAEALDFSEATLPSSVPPREYEIRLTDSEALRLIRLGYYILPAENLTQTVLPGL